MAKKIYLYDSEGYDFYVCEHEGVDPEGKPRLTIMTPGHPVENFFEHLDIIGDDPGDYHLLCEDGKPADSKLVIEMLGQIFLKTLEPFPRMADRLEVMRKYGIIYDREVQTVRFRICVYEQEDSKSKKYRLFIYVGNNRFVSESNDYDSFSDILDELRSFISFIENHVLIPLKKILEVNELMMKQMNRHSTDLFDEIETYGHIIKK